MRAPWRTARRDDHLTDALAMLVGWTREDRELTRTLPLDDTQHAALTEYVKLLADAHQLRPDVRRSEGQTEIRLGSPGLGVTEGTVTMAARIEDAYRTITGHAHPA